MGDILFPAGAGERPLPSEIRRTAWIDLEARLRFTLIRRWRAGPVVNFIGHNGASAGADKDDPTSLRWIHFASAWGFGGYVATNMFPFMTADPAECWQRIAAAGPGSADHEAMERNLEIVRIEARSAGLVVPCWGNLAIDKKWEWKVLDTIYQGGGGPDLYCFGKTLSGAPMHPMARGKHRILDDAKPVIWRKAA